MLTPDEMERRLEEARIERAKVLVARMTEREAAPLPKVPEAQGWPEPASNPSPDADQGVPSVEQDHAQVMEMLTSPEMQRRLEEARAQREKVLAARAQAAVPPTPVPDVGRTLEAEVFPTGPEAPPSSARAEEPVQPLVLRGARPARDVVPVGPPPLRALERMAVQAPERRQSWPLSLAIGLVAGLALGTGLMRLAEVAPSWVSDSLARVGLTAQDSPGATLAATGPQGIDVWPPSGPSPIGLPPGRLRPAPSGTDPTPLPRAAISLGAPETADGAPAVEAANLPSGLGAWQPPPSWQAGLEEVQPPPTALASAPFLPGRTLPSLTGPAAHDEAILAGAPATPASPPEGPPQVALHLPPGLPETALAEAQAALRDAGFALAGTSVAGFGASESTVLFFHADDAAEAALAAQALGAEPRDFSAYRPAPPPGTLEVWLAREG